MMFINKIQYLPTLGHLNILFMNHIDIKLFLLHKRVPMIKFNEMESTENCDEKKYSEYFEQKKIILCQLQNVIDVS